MKNQKKESRSTSLLTLATILTIAFILLSAFNQAYAGNLYSSKNEISFYPYRVQLQGDNDREKILSLLVSKNMVPVSIKLTADRQFYRYHGFARNVLSGQIVPVRIVFPSK